MIMQRGAFGRQSCELGSGLVWFPDRGGCRKTQPSRPATSGATQLCVSVTEG